MIARLAFASFRRDRVRLILASLGVAAATALLTWSLGLCISAMHQCDTRAASLCAPWTSWVSEAGIGEAGGRRGKRPASPDAKRGNRPRPETAVFPGEHLSERGGTLNSIGEDTAVFRVVRARLDVRPGGRILQGPPLTAGVVEGVDRFPFKGTLKEGRWPTDGTAEAAVCTGTFAPRKLEPTKPGEKLTLVLPSGPIEVTVVGIIDFTEVLRGFPSIFLSSGTLPQKDIPRRPNLRLFKGTPPKVDGKLHTPKEIAATLSTDALGNFKKQAPLLLTLCALTALCMLVNALVIGVENRTREYALLRCAGATARQIAGIVALEGLCASFAGWLFGTLAGTLALAWFISLSLTTFPEGMAMGWQTPLATFLFVALVSALALHIPCRRALRIRPLDRTENTEVKRGFLSGFLCMMEKPLAPLFGKLLRLYPSLLRGRLNQRTNAAQGTVLTIAAGLGTFAAIHIWGASMMQPFLPSPEFPDAIVSLLPAGVPREVSAKLGKLSGVRDGKCTAIEAWQVAYGENTNSPHANILLFGVDTKLVFGGDVPMSPMKFCEGSAQGLEDGTRCVITKMFSNATGIHAGGTLEAAGRKFEVAGVVDLNWHLVTSRGQVRGRNGFTQATMGPVFIEENTVREVSVNQDRTFFLWANLSADHAALGALNGSLKLEEEIRTALGEDCKGVNVGVHHRDEIADGTIAHGSQLIGDMARAPFWSLVILCTGVVTLLATSCKANARSFAAMRSAGMAKGQLFRLLLGETGMVATAGIVLSLVLGTAIGFGFTFLTRAAMPFPGLPITFSVPWIELAKGILFALALCTLFALPTIAYLIGRNK